MQRLIVVKAWYQNDFGRVGLRDERLTRALLDDPRVERVVHLEPPLPPDLLAPDGAGAEGLAEGRLSLFTPTFARTDANPWPGILKRTARFLAEAGAFGESSLLWVNAPGALGDRLLAALGGRFGRIVGEVEDDHREYLPPRSEERLAVQRRYERIVRASDLLVSNAQSMIDEWGSLQPNALRVPNAVDPTPYRATPPEPPVLHDLGRPRITYAGNLRLRLEPRLLVAVARAFPEASLVLAGVGGEELRKALPPLPNVRFVGCRPVAEVPALLMHSDVLLLPHAVGALTDSMDPQKVYEYLASGRPIVATPVAGAREQGDLLALAATEDGFVAAVGAALRESGTEGIERAERRRARAFARTWSDAAREVLDAALAVASPRANWRAEQKLGYFQHDRPEVRRHVPAQARRILDVGCGAGALGGALRFLRDVHVTGIELDPAAAERARGELDRVRVGDALAQLRELPDGAFDCILFADLLEHLAEPERALREARRLLTSGGAVVASLPNVRHWSVLRQLLAGDFRYEAAGILDRTHLRFFTRQSALRLFAEEGFAVERCEGTRWAEDGMPAPVAAALAQAGVAGADLVAESREHQFLFVARAAVTSAPSAIQPEATPAATPAAATRALRASIVIPVCNAVDYTRTCLAELRVRGGPDLEVVVVDNGSTDGTAALLAGHAEVRTIRNAENRGFAAAVNQGLAAARAPVVCVLNNDTLLTDGWLEPMVGLLAQEPRIGLVGPCTSYAKGRQQIALVPAGRPPGSQDDMRALVRARIEAQRGRTEDVHFLSGFCFVGRRDELLALHGLADAYGRGTFEDDELCRRLRRAGRRLVIALDSFVWHFGNRTFQALAIDLAQQQQENQRRFVERHRDDAGLLARLAFDSGQVAAALKLAAASLRQAPLDLDALWIAAAAAERGGRPLDARRWIERYLQLCPTDPLGRELLTRCEAVAVQPVPPRNELPAQTGCDKSTIDVSCLL